jgi:hypothetical protein
VTRYASTVKIVFTANPNDASQLYRPYIEVNYAERMTTDIQQKTQSASFRTSYKYSSSGVFAASHGLFITVQVLSVLLAAIRIYNWTKHNPRRELDSPLKAFRDIAILITKTWSDFMFFYLAIMSGYWLVSFKMKNSVTFYPPDFTESDYTGFKVMYAFMVTFQFTKIWDKLHK